ncbi:MAG: tetratricopeptide repeat protein, partial [Alphaproteobacteria bacterium]|nr:tetratricopeptide repeat protein [Alphaproteobacteria bacterium]
DLLRALELQPGQPYVLNYLGYSWVEQGVNLERAREMIEEAVKLKPRDGYIIDSLGWVLFHFGEFERAVRELERAVELRPHDSTINDHLGDAYWRTGRRNEARFQWRRALNLDPTPELAVSLETKLTKGLDNAGDKPDS